MIFRVSRLVLVVLGLSLVGVAAQAGMPGAGKAKASSPAILLALGDSLAAGYQPIYGRTLPPVDARTHYRDQGYPDSYPADIARARRLSLVDLACPGETTSTMLGKPAEAACAHLYRAEFGASSQITAALALLARSPRSIALVTLDIGPNDLNRCIAASAVNYACLGRAEVRLQRDLTAILERLKTALQRFDPGTRLVTMNFYDPYLALALRPGGAQGLKGATASLAAVNGFNTQVQTTARLLRTSVANVARAFHINSLLPVYAYAGRLLPDNVVTTCRLTWMCAGSREPDIHPNKDGYAAIAGAFNRSLGTRP